MTMYASVYGLDGVNVRQNMGQYMTPHKRAGVPVRTRGNNKGCGSGVAGLREDLQDERRQLHAEVPVRGQ